MPKQNRTRYAVLGLLSFGPHSGYDLKRRFEERMNHFWSESLGQIYPTLSRLKDEGLVHARRDTGAGRERIEYTITARGRKELAQWLSSASTPQPVRNELLLKVFLSTPDSLSALADDIRGQAQIYSALLSQYGQFETQIEAVAPAPLQARLWKLTLRLGELVAEARHTWCEEALQELEALNPKQEVTK